MGRKNITEGYLSSIPVKYRTWFRHRRSCAPRTENNQALSTLQYIHAHAHCIRYKLTG